MNLIITRIRRIASDKLIERRNKSAIIINEDETLSIILNEEEHIKIQGITAGFEIEETYKIVNAVDDLISKDFSYEFDKEYGYLTSNVKKSRNRVKDIHGCSFASIKKLIIELMM